MLITRKSPLTGKINEMDLPVTLSQLAAHALGRHMVQDIFPDLNADQREFIMTGYTAEDWARIFPPSPGLEDLPEEYPEEEEGS